MMGGEDRCVCCDVVCVSNSYGGGSSNYQGQELEEGEMMGGEDRCVC